MSDDKVAYDADLSGAGLAVAVVRARFNAPVVEAMRDACIAELERLGVVRVHEVAVPGALEIPLALKTLAPHVDCMVAIGCVIRGETYHFEVVCNESCRGVTDVQLATGVPVANAILTVENETQARARIGKGAEAARVAVEMACMLRSARG